MVCPTQWRVPGVHAFCRRLWRRVGKGREHATRLYVSPVMSLRADSMVSARGRCVQNNAAYSRGRSSKSVYETPPSLQPVNERRLHGIREGMCVLRGVLAVVGGGIGAVSVVTMTAKTLQSSAFGGCASCASLNQLVPAL